MRIVVSDFMSLDGIVQAPGGPGEDTSGGFRHGGWSMPLFDTDVMGKQVDADMEETTVLLYGRRTYETMANFWPKRAGDPFADKSNAMEKIVVSSTLRLEDVNKWPPTTIIDPKNLREEIEKLRSREGGIAQIWGSTQLPIILGGGKSIFPSDGEARRFELLSSKVAKTGVLICRYRVLRSEA
ncbi:bifunctional deaminase-reductase domain-containing protein, partial [Hyaloraphidium curvatum]